MRKDIAQNQKAKSAAEIILAALIFALLSKEFAGPSFAGSALREAEKENIAAALFLKAGNAEEKRGEERAQEAISPGQYPIMGRSDVTAEDLARYFAQNRGDYPAAELSKGGAGTIDEFCGIYCEEAGAEGVRAEVAFAQAMKETGWLRFGGDAAIKQFNFAGLGVTGGGAAGNSFPDVRTGVRAQIQHLKAYATTGGLNRECVDRRYTYVKRGSAPYVQWLGQQENPLGAGWASDSGYGYSIAEMIAELNSIKFRAKH